MLQINLPWLDDIGRAKRPVRVPVVLTRDEVAQVLNAMSGKHWLMASLLYGSGLRLVECLRLRVQDLDFEYLLLTIRDGKGSKDRRTIISKKLVPRIEQHLIRVRSIYDRDMKRGLPGVSLPYAIRPKIPGCSQGMEMAVRISVKPICLHAK